MVESGNRVVCIVDTSLLLFGNLIPREEIRYITSPRVVEEIYKDNLKREVVKGYIASGRLEVEEPEEEFLEKAVKIARDIGEMSKLSSADLDIIALAIKYVETDTVIVITDDFSIQNILENLEIDYLPVRRKIRDRIRRWRFICIKCGKKFLNDIQICPVCGGRVTRYRVRP